MKRFYLGLFLLAWLVSACGPGMSRHSDSGNTNARQPRLAPSEYPSLQTKDPREAILEVARWVRTNKPEFFDHGFDGSELEGRKIAYVMMTFILNTLRANGFDAGRVDNHPNTRAEDDPFRYGSDAVALMEGSVAIAFDIYLAWPIPGNPYLGELGPTRYHATSDLIPVGGATASNRLTRDQTMQPGDFVQSSNGQYRLEYRSDGNLVFLETSSNRVLWASGTTGAGTVVMQGDGNLVIYSSASGRPLWASNTAEYPDAYLSVEDDGRAAVFSSDGLARWSTGSTAPAPRPSPTPVPAPGPGPGPAPGSSWELASGAALQAGMSLIAENRQYELVYQGDGNLVLYDQMARKPLWASNTDGRGTGRVEMQADGNLVMLSAAGTRLWQTGTNRAGSKLVVQSDGNVVIYTNTGTPVWATGTNR
ncbi:MAG TPA: hypothetical protein VFV50_19025 [Bdellovibrionales bacterium]|nr:hypothetical protein [Bdellovibrionales bacterium]